MYSVVCLQRLPARLLHVTIPSDLFNFTFDDMRVSVFLNLAEDLETNEAKERINYNERFWWSYPWSQGRIGFGPYGKHSNSSIVPLKYCEGQLACYYLLYLAAMWLTLLLMAPKLVG